MTDSTPPRIRLTIRDGGRHKQPTGYGKNARSFILGLAAQPDFEVSLVPTKTDWGLDDWYREPLEAIPLNQKLEDADIILQLGAPASCRKTPRPNAMFTNIDVSEMSEADAKHLANADMLLAPNRANFEMFSRRFRNVRLCQQGVHEPPFRERRRFREEGDPKFSLLFIGSFSYRKGVDLLLRAFAEEFEESEAKLTLHLPGEMASRANEFIQRTVEEVGRPVDIAVSTKQLTEAWLARIYNRHDAFVTLTRGEGWGLPIVEAMLCELPVIAPFSTGMRDYLTEEVAALVPTRTVPLDQITDPFAGNFVKSHGAAGVSIEEPDVAVARQQMRRLKEDAALRHRMGAAARAHILRNFSEKRFVASVADALRALHAQTLAAKEAAAAEAAAAAAAKAAAQQAVALADRLEIGAGDRPTPGYLHNDIRPLPGIDLVCDARAFGPEHQGRYTEVLAANVIETFGRTEVRTVLATWAGLLKPGGVLKIVTPDAREIARQLVENRIGMEFYAYLAYGGEAAAASRIAYAFDADLLAAMLETLELEVIRKRAGAPWEQRKGDVYAPVVEVWGRRPERAAPQSAVGTASAPPA
jgi:glycosyltransferase involved in cell wall biosynthesis